jgi:hypothetical protein
MLDYTMGLWDFLGFGGKAAETRTAITQIADTVNESTFKFLSRRVSRLENRVTNIQNLNVSKIKALGCTLNITQSGSITAVAIQQLSDEDAVDLKSEIENALTQKANTDSKTESGFLPMSGGTLSQTDQTFINKIRTIVTRDITKETVNEMINAINSAQQLDVADVTIDPCGLSLYTETLKKDPPEYFWKYCDPRQPCNISQDMAIASVARQITNSVMSAATDDININKTDQSGQSSSSAKTKGIFESIGSIFGDGPFGKIMFFLIIGLVIFIIFKVVMARKEAAATVVSAAAPVAAAAPKK